MKLQAPTFTLCLLFSRAAALFGFPAEQEPLRPLPGNDEPQDGDKPDGPAWQFSGHDSQDCSAEPSLVVKGRPGDKLYTCIKLDGPVYTFSFDGAYYRDGKKVTGRYVWGVFGDDNCMHAGYLYSGSDSCVTLTVPRGSLRVDFIEGDPKHS